MGECGVSLAGANHGGGAGGVLLLAMGTGIDFLGWMEVYR
jgi:hypothetical protein